MRFEPSGLWNRCRRVALTCLTLCSLSVLPSLVMAEAAPGQDEIRASYDVGVAAIDLGTFDLTATVRRNDYALRAKGDFSILGGLIYRAKGQTQSSGKRVNASPVPKRFNFSYSDNKKKQKLQIDFSEGADPAVTRTPKKRPDKKAVPLLDGQVQNALDPLTAAFLSVQPAGPPGDLAVCNQTLRVFDGKRLFELTLSPKRTEELGSRAPAGLRAAAVCAVQYRPIGGHRPNSSTVAFLQKSKDIEAWLVPVPGTDIVVPYRVVVPTSWGNGTAKLTKLKTPSTAPRRASAR